MRRGLPLPVLLGMVCALALARPVLAQDLTPVPTAPKVDEATRVLYAKLHSNSDKVYRLLCGFINAALAAAAGANQPVPLKPNAGVAVVVPHTNSFGTMYYIWKGRFKFGPAEPECDMVVFRTSEEAVWLFGLDKEKQPVVYEGRFDVRSADIPTSSLRFVSKEAATGLSMLYFPVGGVEFDFSVIFTYNKALEIPAGAGKVAPSKTDSKS